MLKIKNYLILMEEIKFIKYDEVYEILEIFIKQSNQVIEIKKCSKKDFNDLVEKIED